MLGNTISIVFKCKKCNIIYNSRSGLWKHNKVLHGNTHKQNADNHQLSDKLSDKHKETKQKKSYYCSKCNYLFAHYQSRWRHEKICTNKNMKEDIVLKKLDQLSNDINQLQNKSQKKFINNGTIVNSTNNNKLVINKIGTENILELNNMEITP